MTVVGRESERSFILAAKQFALLTLAIATGYLIGNFSLLAGYAAGSQSIGISDPPLDFLNGFRLLKSPVAIPNALFIAITAWCLFFYPVSATLKTWWLIIAAEGLLTTVGLAPKLLGGWLAKGAAAASWTILLSWLGSGFWIYYGWRKNRRARELLAMEPGNEPLATELAQGIAGNASREETPEDA